jgi:IclR family acetate operon transcriptional repressor
MSKSSAPALTRGLEIIEILAQEQRPIGFNELMERMGLNASSLNRYLNVLVRKGYVAKDGQGRRGYALGLHLLALSHSNKFWERLHHYAAPILRETTARYRVTSLIVGFSGRQMIILDRVLGPDNIGTQEIGEVKTDYLWVPWGALFLAHVSDKERVSMVEQMELAHNRMGRPATPQELKERIELFRSLGYVDDRGTQIPQVRRIAAPVYGPNDTLIAALASNSLEAFLRDGVDRELVSWLKGQAAKLSQLLQVGD